MARIPYPEPANQTEAARSYIERSGNMNILRMLSHASPAVFEGFNQLSVGIMRQSTLDAVLREIAILRVAYLSNAAYEIYHHESVGRQVGLSDAQLDAIRGGAASAELFDAAQRAVLEFSSDVILNVRASDANLAAVREHLSEGELLDLLMAIGCYMMLARMLETTGVDIDQVALTQRTLEQK